MLKKFKKGDYAGYHASPFGDCFSEVMITKPGFFKSTCYDFFLGREIEKENSRLKLLSEDEITVSLRERVTAAGLTRSRGDQP